MTSTHSAACVWLRKTRRRLRSCSSSRRVPIGPTRTTHCVPPAALRVPPCTTHAVGVGQAAEADAESKYLAGLGVARQRAAIVNGLRESVISFSNEVEGTTSAQVMDMMVLTQVRGVCRCVSLRACGIAPCCGCGD
jgi:hypothetical protein